MDFRSGDISDRLGKCMDFVEREVVFRNGIFSRSAVKLFYLGTMCDADFISHYVVEPLSQLKQNVPSKEDVGRAIHAANFGEVENLLEAVKCVLAGDSVVIFESIDYAIYIEAKKIQTRPIEKSQFDTSLVGSYESFNELLVNNISLIRKRLNNENLRVEEHRLGTQSRTQTALLYVEGLAPEDLVTSVRHKLDDMEMDVVLNIENVAERLSPGQSLFDTMGYTEKPDAVVSRLCEGRIAVMMNGSSFTLTAPYFFFENMQAPDDYASNRLLASSLRLLRFASAMISLLLPAIFVALTTHHFSLIPTAFIFKLAVSRSGVPFPTVVEVLLLFFFFELAREAGRRLPQQVGQALSIVGALILGDAAVGAGLASQATVVVIGIYAITSFINTRLAPAIAVWSVALILLSALFGLHGFYLGFFVFVAHLASLRTCDYPYLFPFGTEKSFRADNRDILIRGSLSKISHPFVYRGEKK